VTAGMRRGADGSDADGEGQGLRRSRGHRSTRLIQVGHSRSWRGRAISVVIIMYHRPRVAI